MKTTKLEKLICTYIELGFQLKALDYSELILMLESWRKSISQIESAVNDPVNKILPSQFVSGLEQGLNETPLILSSLAENKRITSLKVFYRVVESNFPDFFKGIRLKLDEIVNLELIKSEKEWHIVRNRIDEIEGNESDQSELLILYGLVGNYEKT